MTVLYLNLSYTRCVMFLNDKHNFNQSIYNRLLSKSTVKPVLSSHSKRTPKISFEDRLSLNAGQKYCRMLQWEHSAILLTLIKLPFVIKNCVLSFFEWQLKIGFTVILFT